MIFQRRQTDNRNPKQALQQPTTAKQYHHQTLLPHTIPIAKTIRQMEEAVVLDELEFDDESVGEGLQASDDETEKVKAQKRAKQSPLHQHYVAPLSFLIDAANSDNLFNITRTRARFGNNLEAYVRPCYEGFLQLILRKRKECLDKLRKNHQQKRSTLFVIRGSSGIGKSTFLAYFMGRARSGGRFPNIAVFYGSKSSKSIPGDQILSETLCYVVKNGATVIHGSYGDVRKYLLTYLSKMDLIIMDGCSMPFDLSGFTGTLVVAGPPSLYVKNLIDAIIDHYMLTMPPLLDEEAFEIGDMLGVDESVVREKFESHDRNYSLSFRAWFC